MDNSLKNDKYNGQYYAETSPSFDTILTCSKKVSVNRALDSTW